MDEGEVRELYNPKSSLKLRLLPSRLVAAFQAKVFNELCCSSVCFLFHTSSLFLRFPLHSTPTQRDSTQLYSPRCAAPVKCGDDDDVDDALDRSQQQNRKWRQGQGKHRVAEGKWEGEGWQRMPSNAFNYQLSADYLFHDAKVHGLPRRPQSRRARRA